MFLLPNNYWEVQTTKEKGKGVFAAADIEPGVVIGDYIGKVIHPDEEDAYEEKHGFYSMYYHDNASIFPEDPKQEGTHLLNHSCAPNCWMYTYKGHTLFFTIRKIFKGEELTISYLLSPIDDDCKPCKDQCKCNSLNCSETIHMSEKKYNQWIDLNDKITKKTKMAKVRLGETLAPLSSYPDTISDNQFYTLIGSDKKKPVVYKDTKFPTVLELRKRIRETGRFLHFPKLNVIVYGISDGHVIAKVK